MNEESLLNPREAASYLTMSLAFVYKRAATGDLPTLRIGRSLRFRRSGLDAWVNAQNKKKEGEQ
jgi:excisionase family DNA binding protein